MGQTSVALLQISLQNEYQSVTVLSLTPVPAMATLACKPEAQKYMSLTH